MSRVRAPSLTPRSTAVTGRPWLGRPAEWADVAGVPPATSRNVRPPVRPPGIWCWLRTVEGGGALACHERRVLEPSAGSVRAGRHFVADVLTRWELDGQLDTATL